MDANKAHSLVRDPNGRWVEEKMAVLDPAEGMDAERALARLRAARRSANRGRRWTWAAPAAMAGTMALFALPAPRAVAQRCWQSFCSVEGNFVGKQKAPDFSLKDAEGRRVRLSDFRGKVVVVDFWATDCGGCRVEIPWFVEFQREYRDRGLVIVGLSLDEAGWTTVKPFMLEKGINYRIALASDEVTNRYHVESMPTTVMIDRAGKIAATHVGLGEREKFRAEIEDLLRR